MTEADVGEEGDVEGGDCSCDFLGSRDKALTTWCPPAGCCLDAVESETDAN